MRRVDGPFHLSAVLATLVLGHDKKSAPYGAGTPMHGASPTEIGHDRLMETVPPRADNPPPLPESRADGCPGCVDNVELPNTVEQYADGMRATYLCNDCGHAWTTDWRN